MPSFPIATAADCPFPIENIPFGVFSTDGESPRAATIVGSHILDLAFLEAQGLFKAVLKTTTAVFAQPTLNAFARQPQDKRAAVRQVVIDLLSNGASPLFANSQINAAAFHDSDKVHLHLPMDIPEFTDFSCFEEHVGNACKMSGMPMLKNFYHSPIAYNGRVSSMVPSGTSIHRPKGMYKDESGQPKLLPSMQLDYELELGILISNPVPYGQTITADQAHNHIFGYSIINDWSARDIQSYESIPAGPFNSKSFATSMAPWVIVPEALQWAKAAPLNQKDGEVQPHLRHESLADTIYDIDFNAYLGRAGAAPQKVSTTNLKHSYFSLGQMLCHRASSGCGLRTAELVATGTISSPENEWIDKSVGHNASLWELSWNGSKEVPVVGGQFIGDNDTVVFDGWATGKNGKRIGFGSLETKVLPAV
ncbi:hypothetical protein BAUCODRAFT_543794 [Baudoinia panamericana UAMH 10762]|uniref:Fumarylacetoacetase n=1 Tax=Baudoinia panamericana (strain UAMH 10762) TaxID=717646 RepID=M2MVA9_BAUPA|nr:uncharacterized protein BAUCODRAFT_543794 [Baudoinia panamericana UAMH 10762]EMC95503.1 hypothetical protein BAUCODRAFT_543794 [Baudoinia panamericana UAMH 10762]